LEERLKTLFSGRELSQEYPELAKYIAYLKKVRSLNAPDVLEEEKRLEQALYQSLAGTEDEKRIVSITKGIRLLESLFNFETRS